MSVEQSRCYGLARLKFRVYARGYKEVFWGFDMKFKFIFVLLLIVSAIAGTFYGLTHWSLHKGATAGYVQEFSSTGSWPVRYIGVYRDLLTGEEREFSVFDPVTREQLQDAVGQKVVLLTENHFLSLWNSHAHSVRGVQELQLSLDQGSSSPENSDSLCRLVEIVRRSAPMVEVLKERMQKYDPELLGLVRQCSEN